MKVKLLNYTPLWVCSSAIRKCWASEDKSDTKEYEVDVAMDDIEDFHLQGTKITGPKDRALIDRIGNKNKHSSTLEHLYYNFDIDGISRACLQELARHRIASLSVKSTRYTLKELKDGYTFQTDEFDNVNAAEASKYIVFTENLEVNYYSYQALCNLQELLRKGISNDVVKYCLPECYKTSLGWSINARALQNFLRLRTSPHALKEIRELANEIFHALPDDHKYLFEECISN